MILKVTQMKRRISAEIPERPLYQRVRDSGMKSFVFQLRNLLKIVLELDGRVFLDQVAFLFL